MKSYRRYAIRRIAFEMTKEEIAEKIKCDLSAVDNYEKGIWVPKWIYEGIRYAIWQRTKCLSLVKHLQGRIMEIAMLLKEETNKAEALNYIDHMEIELIRLRKFYTESLIQENEAK